MAKRHYTSAISQAFGKFASKEHSPLVQHAINAAYVKLMGLDMSEFREPSTYKSLNALFTRPLEKPRPMPNDPHTLISSVDALVTDWGEIQEGKAYQIKGMSYDIEGLFGVHHQAVVSAVEGGVFMNFYLSPKDYHRYHMPMDLQVKAITHIPGKLYPVNFPLLCNMPNLFIENERVILECQDVQGRTHVLVLVGALNVGKMVVTFEPEVRTNSDITEPQHYTYDDLHLKRGELLGWFEMGSTILHFAQKGAVVPELAINQKVKFAEPIGKIL